VTTFTIKEKAPILVEFEPRRGVVKASLSPQDVVQQSAAALDSAMNTIYQMARRVTVTIDALIDRPSEVEVAFGIKLDAEAGALIAKAGVEGSIGVKLTWERTEKPVAVLPSASTRSSATATPIPSTPMAPTAEVTEQRP
jgi:hypothetical protein